MTDKFIINKSLDNTFTLTIKQQSSTLPMVLDESDTFVGHLYKLDTNTEVDCGITITKLQPYINGKIELTIGTTTGLVIERGSKADRYYLKPTYRLAIECSTLNNGDFVAKVDNVYVDA